MGYVSNRADSVQPSATSEKQVKPATVHASQQRSWESIGTTQTTAGPHGGQAAVRQTGAGQHMNFLKALSWQSREGG